jgi:aminopeptidase
MLRHILFIFILLSFGTMAYAQKSSDWIAEKIANALKLGPGERVLIRFDPQYMQELVLPLRQKIREAGAIDLAAMEYVSDAQRLESLPLDDAKRKIVGQTQIQAFEELLNSVDVYLWLATSGNRDLYSGEEDALRNWSKKGGSRREIHFHWASGSMNADGLPGQHSASLDQMYADAIDIEYATLSADQERAIRFLRSGAIHVTTPAGTNLSFQVGNRPFNKQDGDASIARVQAAKVLVDREIELPAGVIRVAPLEETVQGTLVVPQARFGDAVARNIRMEFKNGRMTGLHADDHQAEVEAELSKVGDAAHRFREFGLGMNPKLTVQNGDPVIPYYGYGAGVVRLSLGDNQELGGAVKGGFVRWFFFRDATVEVNGRAIVKDGKLVSQ